MATEARVSSEDEREEDNDAIVIDEPSTSGFVRERKKMSGIWMFFVIDKSDKTKAICLTCQEKVSRVGNNPLEYWKLKKTLWPCLCFLACKYLAISPSTIASE